MPSMRVAIPNVVCMQYFAAELKSRLSENMFCVSVEVSFAEITDVLKYV